MRTISAIAGVGAVIGLTLLAACGGGGGGGGGSGVRILHGALDESPLQLCAGACDKGVMSTTRFAEVTSYVSGGSGDTTLRSTDGHTSFSVPAGDGRRSIVVAQGAGRATRITVLSDGMKGVADGQAALRVVHAVHLAGALDVLDGENKIAATVPGDAQAPYVLVPAGGHDLRIQDPNGGTVRYTTHLTLQSRAAYTLLVTGELDYLVLGMLYAD